jgi:hypothetical protein
MEVSGQLHGPATLYPVTHWIEDWVRHGSGPDDPTLPCFELRPLGRPTRCQSLYSLSYHVTRIQFLRTLQVTANRQFSRTLVSGTGTTGSLPSDRCHSPHSTRKSTFVEADHSEPPLRTSNRIGLRQPMTRCFSLHECP